MKSKTGVCGILFGMLLILGLPQVAEAARLIDLVETNLSDQVMRFFSFQDPAVRFALWGTALLGICCGIMGCFLVVRQLSLMGDALSHAVLPGVALGFMWSMKKDPLAIFVGATIAGLLGAATVQILRQTTRHREDAALGFVLASFYGVGICLLTLIQNLPAGDKSGLSSFMFGQVAAMGEQDVLLLAMITLLVVGWVVVFFKELQLASFDEGFGRSLGWKMAFWHYTLMLLLAFAVVASLQAVGVVLVTAMLIIPAATAILLTDRFGWMLFYAALIGLSIGLVGSFFSFVGRHLPTGPFMVLAAAALFTLTLFLAPRHGWLPRWWRLRRRRSKTRRENLLKIIYRLLEQKEFQPAGVNLSDIRRLARLEANEIATEVESLVQNGLATCEGDEVLLTPHGWSEACRIVRNHRLWELYLTDAARWETDHVHDDAEEVEHQLSEATIRRLEKRLNYAQLDPHGKKIPGWNDLPPGRSAPRATGFGKSEDHRP